MPRKYTLRSKQDQLLAINQLIARLDVAAAKRMDKIGRLRNKAQRIQNAISISEQLHVD